jgi:hypothetical protein
MCIAVETGDSVTSHVIISFINLPVQNKDVELVKVTNI